MRQPKPQAHLSCISPYVAGKTAKDGGKKPRDLIKLSSNESNFGPSPRVLKALQNALPEIFRYPDIQSVELREAIAGTYGLTPDHVILGNGSNEIIQCLLTAYAPSTSFVFVPQNGFSMYRIYAQMLPVNTKPIPLTHDFSIDIDYLISQSFKNCAAVFLTSPNNPTGKIIPLSYWRRLLDKIPRHVLLVIDEAYGDFSNPKTMPDWQSILKKTQHTNIVVLKTFSKSHALAGLRIGYAVASPVIIRELHRVRQPFNINQLAQLAALHSLRDKAHYQKVLHKTRAGRSEFEHALSALKIPFIPSEANFIMIEVGNAETCFEFMKSKGILVRELTSFGFPAHVRITIGKPDENKKCLTALKNYFKL